MASGKYGLANLQQPRTNVSFLLDEMGLADVYWSWKSVKKPGVLVKVGKFYGDPSVLRKLYPLQKTCSWKNAAKLNCPVCCGVGGRRTNITVEEHVAQQAEGWMGREQEVGPIGLAAWHWGNCFTCPCATASPTIKWDDGPGFSL